MTEKQWWAIENLLTAWYCEIYDENENLIVARGSCEIVNEIEKILDNPSYL